MANGSGAASSEGLMGILWGLAKELLTSFMAGKGNGRSKKKGLLEQSVSVLKQDLLKQGKAALQKRGVNLAKDGGQILELARQVLDQKGKK